MSLARLARRVGPPLRPVDPVTEAARQMRETGTCSVLVADHGVLVGIVTERDVVRRVVAHGADAEGVSLAEIMSSPVEAVPAATAPEDADARMKELAVRHLVVVDDDGAPLGVLTAPDLLRRRIESLAEDVRSLEAFVLVADSLGG